MKTKQLPDLEGGGSGGADLDRRNVAVLIILANIFNSLYCLQLCFAELYVDARTCYKLIVK